MLASRTTKGTCPGCTGAEHTISGEKLSGERIRSTRSTRKSCSGSGSGRARLPIPRAGERKQPRHAGSDRFDWIPRSGSRLALSASHREATLPAGSSVLGISNSVTPANAGVQQQTSCWPPPDWIPAFAGMTGGEQFRRSDRRAARNPTLRVVRAMASDCAAMPLKRPVKPDPALSADSTYETADVRVPPTPSPAA